MQQDFLSPSFLFQTQTELVQTLVSNLIYMPLNIMQVLIFFYFYFWLFPIIVLQCHTINSTIGWMAASIRGNGWMEKPMVMGQKPGPMVRYGMMANGKMIVQYDMI